MKSNSKFFNGAKLGMNMLANFLLAMFFAIPIAAMAGVNPLGLTLGITGVSTIYQTAKLRLGYGFNTSTAFQMAIQKEIWERDIVANIFKDNEFMNYCFIADDYVLQGKVVHIPQAGAVPTVVKNRSSLPATVVKRTDVDVTYSIDELTSDPVLIPDADTIELSYDKRQSVLAETYDAMRETAAENMLRSWAPTAEGAIIRTTGGNVAAHLDGASGNRKKFLPADLKKAQLMMNRQSIAKKDRYAMFSADLVDQLTDSFTETQYRDFSKAFDPEKGIVGELHGFKILSRATTMSYNDGTPPTLVAFGAAGDDDHCDSVLCWQKNSVERALGEVKFFEDMQNPQYYGDVYSALVRLGGRKRRNDNKGIVAIVQDLVGA